MECAAQLGAFEQVNVNFKVWILLILLRQASTLSPEFEPMLQNFVFIAGVSPPPAPPPAAGLFHSRLKQSAPNGAYASS